MPSGKPGTKAVPLCHPDKEYQANGMCKNCYCKHYRTTHPDKRKNRRDFTNKRFGIQGEEYDRRREEQRAAGDLCGLCKRPLAENPKVNLDHDHLTGKLREFLHPRCNMAIGLLEDDPKLCRLAAEYLEKHKGD